MKLISEILGGLYFVVNSPINSQYFVLVRLYLSNITPELLEGFQLISTSDQVVKVHSTDTPYALALPSFSGRYISQGRSRVQREG